MKPHILALYGAVVIALGAIAGLVCWIFFFLMDSGILIIWKTLPQALGANTTQAMNGIGPWWWPLPVCLIGGVLVGLLQKRFAGLPKELNEVMAQVKKTDRYEYAKLPQSFICALVPLLFGGSIGPEAGLTGVIAGMCTWVGDRLRFLGKKFQQLSSSGTTTILGTVFNAPLFGLAIPAFDDGTTIVERRPHAPKPVKVVVYALAIASALSTFLVLRNLVGGESGIPRFGGFGMGKTEWLLLIPLVLAGSLIGWISQATEKVAGIASGKIGNHPMVKALLAGLMLGCIGCILPYCMFAGEVQSETLKEAWVGMGIALLIATALIKPIVLNFCIQFGWRGGKFFPIIFCGIAMGYALASITGCNETFCLCACTAAAVGAMSKKPALTVVLLCLCFPLQSIIVLLVGAAIGSVIPTPKATKPEDGQEAKAPQLKDTEQSAEAL